MRQKWTETLKRRFRPALFRLRHGGKATWHCPVCDYSGPFKDKVIKKNPLVVRTDSKCPGCASTERHRMMHLVLGDLCQEWDPSQKSVLHIAPEDCLADDLRKRFATYHSADLFKKEVDFQEDIQKMSFAAESYDCVLVSRVLTVPPDLEASLNEIRRVLKPGGIAIIAETYTHEETIEFGEWRNERSREIGVDLLMELENRFGRVERYLSDRYDGAHQLHNLMIEEGEVKDAYPSAVRIEGKGFMDLVAVCHV